MSQNQISEQLLKQQYEHEQHLKQINIQNINNIEISQDNKQLQKKFETVYTNHSQDIDQLQNSKENKDNAQKIQKQQQQKQQHLEKDQSKNQQLQTMKQTNQIQDQNQYQRNNLDCQDTKQQKVEQQFKQDNSKEYQSQNQVQTQQKQGQFKQQQIQESKSLQQPQKVDQIQKLNTLKISEIQKSQKQQQTQLKSNNSNSSSQSDKLQYVKQQQSQYPIQKNKQQLSNKQHQLKAQNQSQLSSVIYNNNYSGLSSNHSKTQQSKPIKLSEQIQQEYQNNLQLSRSSLTKSQLGSSDIKNKQKQNNSDNSSFVQTSLQKNASSPMENIDQSFSTQQVEQINHRKNILEENSNLNENISSHNQANQHDQNYKKNQEQAKKYIASKNILNQKQQENQRKSFQQIIKNAQRQRVSTAYAEFLKYYSHFHAIYQGNKSLIQNILMQLEKKRKLKIVPSFMIKQHFNQQANLLHSFYQKCYSQKLTSQTHIGQKESDKNPMINIKQQLLTGFEQLINTRKSLGNSMNRVTDKIQTHTIKQIEKIFQQFEYRYKDSYKIVQQLKQNFDSKYKQFIKRAGFCKIVFSQIMGGKFSQTNDIFLQLTSFIQIDRFIKFTLNQYGKGVIDFIKKIIKADTILFQQIQSALQSYQQYSSKNHIKIPLSLKHSKINFKNQISKVMQYQNLCTPKDVDYINSLQQIIFSSEKIKTRQLTEKDFQKILNIDWVAVVKVYGHADQMIRGTFLKDFQLATPQKALVLTVCNNLIQFNKHSFDYDNKMIFKNLSFVKIKQKKVKFQEKTKTFIFDNTKKWSFQFYNSNIAEQFVVYISNVL